jgi:hypothetical protein
MDRLFPSLLNQRAPEAGFWMVGAFRSVCAAAACGARVRAFYPQTETAIIDKTGRRETVNCTPIAFRVTGKACRRVLDAKADIRRQAKSKPMGEVAGHICDPRNSVLMSKSTAAISSLLSVPRR